jgi:hypothetical protein
MKNPGSQCRSVRLGRVGALFALASAVLAQPPDAPTKKPVSRPRPQVIYHLPSSSNSAAALHSQAKGQNNDLPIAGSMPTSLQTSHANANAAAAQAREQPVTSPSPDAEIKRPKSQRSQPAKAKGASHPGPKKPHKK